MVRHGEPHTQPPVGSVKVQEFLMVDVAAQNPMCAALSTKSDENAFFSAFVKRMACARAVQQVDPEPALKLSADKIALRASAAGIQLKVETAARFSSQSIGAVGRAKDAVEGQNRCLRLELGAAVVGETRWMVALKSTT